MFNKQRKESILKLLSQARIADKNLEQFGSSSHNYMVNPPINKNLINRLEECYDFKLPEAYFWFINQVANGGAGPGHGIYSFASIIDQDELRNLKYEPILRPDISPEEHQIFYKNYMKEMEAAPSSSEAKELYLRLHQGLLLIATTGMNADIYLVITGENRGRLLFSEPGKLPILSSFDNFVDWYENWLRLTIESYS